MSDMIWAAIISLIGTLAGTFAGIMTSVKLMNYKIDQLKEQVEKHNSVIERTYRLEGRMEAVEENIEYIRKKGG